MTQDPPELFAKKRLPFEEQPNPASMAASAAIIALYGVVAAALVAFTGYMVFVQGRPITELYVFAPLLGAGYFALRAVMMVNAHNKKMKSGGNAGG